jgi:hypothetical protein
MLTLARVRVRAVIKSTEVITFTSVFLDCNYRAKTSLSRCASTINSMELTEYASY